MHRRDFSQGLIAAGLAAPLGGLAGQAGAANWDDHDGQPEDLAAALVRLSIATRLVLIEWLLISTTLGAWGLDLRHPVPRVDENRLPAGKVPVIGRLFRPTLAAEFDNALLVGTVVLLGTSLLLRVAKSAALPRPPGRVVILNRKISYRPTIAPVPVKVDLPGPAALSKLPRVGIAVRNRNDLLVLVRPTLLDRDFPDG